jgi:hypothetical protein
LYVPLKNISLTWRFIDLTDYLLFYVPLKNFSLTITGEGPNLGLCSALRAFEVGGIFIVPHLL